MDIELVSSLAIAHKVDQNIGQVDDIGHALVEEFSPDLISDLGSNNGRGFSNLVALTNEQQQPVLSYLGDRSMDGLADAKSYGTVYLIARVLAKLGVETNVPFYEKTLPETPIDLLPNLLAGLLDTNTRGDTDLAEINRSFCFEPSRELNGTNVQSLILDLAAIEVPETRPGEKRSLQWETSISRWQEGRWPLGPSEDEIRGKQVLFDLASRTIEHVESITGSNWSVVCGHIREIRLAKVDHMGRTIYLTTRLTTPQINLLNRLDVWLN